MAKVWVYIERVIQAFVLVLTGLASPTPYLHLGWYVATVQIGWGWLYHLHGRKAYATAYIAVVNGGFAACLSLYLYLCSRRTTHSIARYPKPDKTQLVEPYPCFDKAGGFRVCVKDGCNGNWAPPRSHHCSTCGVCRLEFDHHCPWVGNCVTIPRLKAFLLLVSLFPLTFAVVTFPVRHILYSHILLALETSQSTPLIKRYWWDWPGSWVIIAGPPGRWIVGTILGFVWLGLQRDNEAPWYTGKLVEGPHFRIISLFGIFLVFALFAAGLGLLTMFTALRGSTTFESLGISGQKRTDLVCIPTQQGASNNQRFVFAPEPHERLYDLGPRANLKRLWDLPLFPQEPPPVFAWSKLNPKMVRRMRASIPNDWKDVKRKAD
ncbi:hypothetical protein NMY22_g16448 [Coprinellus aureogranulatus]|nr:hypothetical protein NMY22_g16448 [Coprinellus aureogranulatus]